MPINLRLRFLKAVLFAVVLGVLFAAIANGQDECDDDCFAVISKPYYPGLCDALEPWGYAWYFFDCLNKSENEAGAALTIETVTLTQDGDTLTTTIDRTYTDGTTRRTVRVQPTKGRR